LISALLNPKTIEFLPNIAFWLFIICLPTAQFYLAIKDKAIFLNMLILSGYYQLFLGLVIFTSMILTTPTYDMVFSYLMLVPIVILTYKMLFIDFRLIDFGLILLAIISVVALGSRGPLLSYFIYLILLIFNYLINERLKAKSFILLLISTALISVFLLNFNYFIEQINIFLLSQGIQSRSIYLLLSDNIDFSTGRSEIFSDTINNIILNPILGHGIAGDRVFLNGTYPHNIFLEILAQFGIILGGISSLILLTYWFKSVFLNKNKTNQHLAIIFAGLGLISLFFSGSYLTSSNFWLFMAICISSVHFTKHKLSFGNSEKLITEKVVPNEKENNF
jgi:O-antigen ligase